MLQVTCDNISEYQKSDRYFNESFKWAFGSIGSKGTLESDYKYSLKTIFRGILFDAINVSIKQHLKGLKESVNSQLKFLQR